MLVIFLFLTQVIKFLAWLRTTANSSSLAENLGPVLFLFECDLSVDYKH